MYPVVNIVTFSGPEVLRWEDVDPGKPGRGEVLVKQNAVSLNFSDVYARKRLYPAPLPGLGIAGLNVAKRLV